MRRNQRGFSLLEALVAIAITSGVVLAATEAVTSSLHASANEALRAALRDDALAVLADLRAATAYDRGYLQSLIGRSSSATITRPDGEIEHVTVAVTASLAGGYRVVATATVAHDTTTVAEQQTLFNEAPAPGSTTAPTP